MISIISLCPGEVSEAVFADPLMKLQRNGFDFIFLTGLTGLTGFFSPSARSPFGRRPFYPDDPAQFSFKDENPFLFCRILIFAFLRFFFDQTGRLDGQRLR